MSAAPTVRPLAPGDVAAWAAMRALLWPDADPRELQDEAERFARGESLPAPHAVFVSVGQAEGGGFLELSVRPFSDGCDTMPVPHVEGWFVATGLRGRGIGRALIAAAEAWARERGFTELASDTEIENESSRRAHASCGFEERERLVKFRKKLA